MTQCIERIGKTVNDAVDAALRELQVKKENVNIEVIEEGSKGLFGIIGSKMAKVKVTVVETCGERTKKYLHEIFEKMGVLADIEVEEDDKAVVLKVSGDEIGIIIGRRGETLDALQYITNLAINKNKENYKKVIIDIENYREKREISLIKLANKLAERVIKYKKNITLEPMTSLERRIIHEALQNHKYVQTYSYGDDPNRKVVITLK